MRTPSRMLHKVRFERQRVFVRFLAFARNDNAKNAVQVALTLCAMRFNFAPFTPG
jgi:hypothetical protein